MKERKQKNKSNKEESETKRKAENIAPAKNTKHGKNTLPTKNAQAFFRFIQNPLLDGLTSSKFVVPELQIQHLVGIGNVREGIGPFQSRSRSNLNVVDLDGLPLQKKQLLP